MVAWSLAAPGTKISSCDPPLPAVRTAYSTEPFQALFHPIVKPTGLGPRGYVDLDRWVDSPTICFAVLARIELHPYLITT